MLPEHGETELQFRESSLGCLGWGTDRRQREAANNKNLDIKSGEKMFCSLKRETGRWRSSNRNYSGHREQQKKNLLQANKPRQDEGHENLQDRVHKKNVFSRKLIKTRLWD